jgi:ATP-dependent DNA ligase
MKPVRVPYGPLVERLLADSAYRIEQKVDGSRLMAYKEGGELQFWNRHGNFLAPELLPLLYANLDWLPDDIALDAEIYPRGVSHNIRPDNAGKYKLAIFDLIVPGVSLVERHAELCRLFSGYDDHSGLVHLVRGTNVDKSAFMDDIMQLPESEGIVLKKLDSKRKDDLKACKEVVDWLKVMKATSCHS